MTLQNARAAAEEAGLVFRGAFHPAPDEMPPGVTVGTIAMLGMTGREWPVFAASPEYRDGKPHPLDRWSYRVIGDMARSLNAAAFFPFTAPPMPFIRWAQKAEPVHPSVLGMLIHPDYGLWHAWRGALGFAQKFALPAADNRPRPCDSCIDKPCLSVCPVNAFDGTGAYNLRVCGQHIRTPEGTSCMSGGCLARRACPVGKAYQYTPEQAAFHMRSFRGG